MLIQSHTGLYLYGTFLRGNLRGIFEPGVTCCRLLYKKMIYDFFDFA